MHDIPETGFLRLAQVLSFIPLGKTSWWDGVRSGRYPKPVKLSPRLHGLASRGYSGTRQAPVHSNANPLAFAVAFC